MGSKFLSFFLALCVKLNSAKYMKHTKHIFVLFWEIACSFLLRYKNL